MTQLLRDAGLPDPTRACPLTFLPTLLDPTFYSISATYSISYLPSLLTSKSVSWVGTYHLVLTVLTYLLTATSVSTVSTVSAR